MQILLATVTLVEYMPQVWFRMVEEEEDKEEALYSCNETVLDIDF